MTETNAKIHVLADETLGGIKREYVEVGRDISARSMGRYVQFTETPNLEPTDIVHIDGVRYVLTDRKAEVGDKILTTQTQFGRLPIGKVLTVTDVFDDDSIGEIGVGIVEKTDYRVLVPVEAEADEPQPADLIDVVSNLAARVGRLHDEIDTLHKDNRTLGEELARLKESATGVKGEKLFTADELAAIIERLLMRP